MLWVPSCVSPLAVIAWHLLFFSFLFFPLSDRKAVALIYAWVSMEECITERQIYDQNSHKLFVLRTLFRTRYSVAVLASAK